MILLSTSAWAEWVLFGKTNDGELFYLDPTTIRGADVRRIWTLTIQKGNGKGSSFKVFWELDCKDGRLRSISAQIFSDTEGNNLLRKSDTPSEWSYPAPQSIKSELFSLVCGKAP